MVDVLPASRLVRRIILLGCHLETPGYRFPRCLHGGRDPQDILAGRGGILHLDVARYAFGVIRWQAYFVECAARSTVDHLPAQFAHKPLAHTLLHHVADLDIRFLEKVLTGQRLRCRDKGGM